MTKQHQPADKNETAETTNKETNITKNQQKIETQHKTKLSNQLNNNIITRRKQNTNDNQ